MGNNIIGELKRLNCLPIEPNDPDDYLVTLYNDEANDSDPNFTKKSTTVNILFMYSICNPLLQHFKF